MSRLTALLRLWLIAATIGLLGSLPADAQSSLVSQGTSEEARSQSDLADAIRQAAEAGVGVVIVDSSGRALSGAEVVAQAGSAMEEEPGVMGGASSMMKAQSELRNFRSKLNERLKSLPSSYIEMAYILRATSPDGRIITYVKVVLMTTVLLLIGRWLSTEIYGKRLIKSYVVSRIEEKPEGYAGKMPFLFIRFAAGLGGTLFAMIFALIVTLLARRQA